MKNNILDYAVESFPVLEFQKIKTKYKRPGIYFFLNTLNGKFYIGSSVNIYERFSCHILSLKPSYKCFCKLLKRSLIKNGLGVFVFGVLEFLDTPTNKERLIAREQHFLDLLRPFSRDVGYNLSPTANSPLGVKRSKKFCAENKKRNIENMTNSKLRPEDIVEIFRLSAEGRDRKYIQSVFNIHHRTVSDILTRYTWYHVEIDPELVRKSEESRLPKWISLERAEEVAIELVKIGKMLKPLTKIAEDMGICRRTLSKINSGKSFPDIFNKYSNGKKFLAQPYIN